MATKIKDSGFGFKKGDAILHNGQAGFVVGVSEDKSYCPILIALNLTEFKGYWRYASTDELYFPALKELFPVVEDPTKLCGWWCRVEELTFLDGTAPVRQKLPKGMPEDVKTTVESDVVVDWFVDCSRIEEMIKMFIDYSKRGYKIDYNPDSKRLTVIYGHKEYRNILEKGEIL